MRTPEVERAMQHVASGVFSVTWSDAQNLAAEVERLEQEVINAKAYHESTRVVCAQLRQRAETRVENMENILCSELSGVRGLEAQNARLRAAMKPLLAMRPDGDIGWRGNLGAKCGWILVRHILAIEAALADGKAAS